MATINHILIKDKDKSSVSDRNYSLCDTCNFHGYPNEKVVYHYKGLRSEEEDGFITIFTVYDYPIQTEKIHAHKYNEKLINKLVKLALGGVKV